MGEVSVKMKGPHVLWPPADSGSVSLGNRVEGTTGEKEGTGTKGQTVLISQYRRTHCQPDSHYGEKAHKEDADAEKKD